MIKVFQPVNDVAVDDPLRELIKSLVDIYEKPIQLVWDVSKFGIPDVDASLFLTCANVNEIILIYASISLIFFINHHHLLLLLLFALLV